MANSSAFFLATIICLILVSGSMGDICLNVLYNTACNVKSKISCIQTCFAAGYSTNLVNSICAYQTDHVLTSCSCYYNC
ncbi:hypothetical protein CASFOL_035984 [Castilleja foliolosa]|uniref:Uncharacterized protein n=1 Tax=Castilleja foliolosa TaxID=1961234 RepID=A0ABD3BUY0_9LAMI